MSNGGFNNRTGGGGRQLSSSSSSVNSKSVPKPKPRRSVPSLTTPVIRRVRVVARLRPPNADESDDTDFSERVELQSELKRVTLRKNIWESKSYEFDEVLNEHASQAHVYDVVAKPVVESVLEGYNGTVMAYGQTGTGKTYTVGGLGEEDPSTRGIMVRAMEDILSRMSPADDRVSVSYIQLYKETIQDLLHPENANLQIVEDPKTGDLLLPGVTIVDIKDQKNYIELLRLGETHRFATNTKLNAESSRSHSILMVYVKTSVKVKDSAVLNENDKPLNPVVRKGKFLVVDLAGSERTAKSGTSGLTLEEGNSINLSLSALGKCINALADNSPHVPVRESKLTRLLKDSFGGSARTSMVITIGPSPRHWSETSHTIKFGQRAMKVENMVKYKEEFDYKGFSTQLQRELKKVTAENERHQRRAMDAENLITEVQRNYDLLEKEKLNIEKSYADLMKKNQEQLHAHGNHKVELLLKDEATDKLHDSQYRKLLAELDETRQLLQKETLLRKVAEEETSSLRDQLSQRKNLESTKNPEIFKDKKMLEAESEEDIVGLQENAFEANETRRILDNIEDIMKLSGDLGSKISQSNHLNPRDSVDPKFHGKARLQNIFPLLESEDADVRIRALKVVANLTSIGSNREMIVKTGGLTALLRLLRNCDDEFSLEVTAGAIANLAINDKSTRIIASEGGIHLLSEAAAKASDPQTLYMVAGAIANLCGKDKLLEKLRSEGGIKALLGMAKCGDPAVLQRVARGIANFAIQESKAFPQGMKKARSSLIEDGALPWIVQNADNEVMAIRRHSEIALCHLAQEEANGQDMIALGAVSQLVSIAWNCPRYDIRSLAHKALTCTPSFVAELNLQQRVN